MGISGMRRERVAKDTTGWDMGAKIQYLKHTMIDNEISAQQLYEWMGITEEQAKADRKFFVEAALAELANHDLVEGSDIGGDPRNWG